MAYRNPILSKLQPFLEMDRKNVVQMIIASVVGFTLTSLIFLTYVHNSKAKKTLISKVRKYPKHHNVSRGIPFIVAEDIREYRELARHCLKSTDVVLEVGCALGVTTDLIRNYCSDVVGIDLSTNQVQG